MLLLLAYSSGKRRSPEKCYYNEQAVYVLKTTFIFLNLNNNFKKKTFKLRLKHGHGVKLKGVYGRL